MTAPVVFPRHIGRKLACRVNGGRVLRALHDLNLPPIRLTHRPMLETHIVRKDMNLTSVLRAYIGWKDVNLSSRFVLEERKLSVEFESRRVIQVNVPCKFC